MKQEDIFQQAVWVRSAQQDDFTLLRRTFAMKNLPVRAAKLYVIGLGFFRCTVNGTEITEHAFLPLSTDYEERKDCPIGEELTGHRILVPQFDVTDLLKTGQNVLTVYYGGGWYNFPNEKERFGISKAIYRLHVEYDGASEDICSSPCDRVHTGYVSDYFFLNHECHDYTAWDDRVYSPDYHDTEWEHAVEAEAMETAYLFSDCPTDGLIEKIMPTENAYDPAADLSSTEYIQKSAESVQKMYGDTSSLEIHGSYDPDVRFYDCGVNTVGFPVLKLKGKRGERVRVRMAEALAADGTLNMRYHHAQVFEVICDGTERTVMPQFTWFGFRAFSVEGPAEVLYTAVVHMKLAVTSDFHCENDTLNWIYEAYIRTQRNNMHCGLASDCPHLERRGYTGDGELTAHAVMTTLDAQKFYQKWMEDISDCQDVKSGHIQYTAPYLQSGGGPGAWGCAIVEVPWQYYRHYGDPEPMIRFYPQMQRYFDYMEAHSENGLVVSDQPGRWCLGDWCPPMQVVLPAPFVNNYYYIKAMKEAVQIAPMAGHPEDVPVLLSRIEARRAAVKAAYFNTWDGNFIGNLQGANAFALDMGLGDERTEKNLADYYRKNPAFDTGICGTEIVVRVLFERGYKEEAVRLLCSEETHSFGGMRLRGATTIWEYWPESHGHRYFGRSLDHPMFGTVAAHLFAYILGIQQSEGSVRYDEIVISPALIPFLGKVSGSQMTPHGRISVSWVPEEDGTFRVTVEIPSSVKASYQDGERILPLKAGRNILTVPG